MGVGVWEGVAATLCVGVREGVAATSSLSPWCVGVLVRVAVAFGDLVGVGCREWDAAGLRVDALDLVRLPVACGDLVGLLRMHAPHVDGT